MFYLDGILFKSLSQYFKPFHHPGLTKEALFDLIPDKFGYQNGKSKGTDKPCIDHVNGSGRGYTFLNSLCHGCAKSSAFESFSYRSIEHSLDNEYNFLVGIDSVAQPASSIKSVTASSTKLG